MDDKFDERLIEQFLQEEDVEVKFDIIKNGEMNNHWMMIWEDKHIRFTDFASPNLERKARRAAAVFLYLYKRNVDPTLARRCAEAYVRTWEIRSLMAK